MNSEAGGLERARTWAKTVIEFPSIPAKEDGSFFFAKQLCVAKLLTSVGQNDMGLVGELEKIKIFKLNDTNLRQIERRLVIVER